MAKNPFGNWPPKLGKAVKARAPKPEKPKNIMGAVTNKARAIEAIHKSVCLRITYDGLPRVVEVHTVGKTRADRPAMSVFQVDGQSHEASSTGWRLFCFDECFDVALTNRPSAAPRPDYRKGAKSFKVVEAEV